MTHAKKNALEALQRVEGKQFDSNIQEGEQTMTSLAQTPGNGHPDEFATIHVSGATVRPRHFTDGTLTVELDHGDEGGVKTYTLGAACALAAALQAVAVHQMEQQPREITRRTAPGQPAFEEAI